MSSKVIFTYLHRVAKEGDRQSFKELYNHYFKRLLHFSFLIVGTKETAEEIVNDVFLKIWERRKTLYEIDNPDVYFYVATKNKSLDVLKSQTTHTSDIENINEAALKVSINPESIMISKELRKKIEKAIETLPPRCKLIFKLVKEDGLKYKEAAAILDLSPKTIENQLSIATKKLIQILLKSPSSQKKQKLIL